MRLIGHLPSETTASTFSDYLYGQGISNEIEVEKEGWAVWIHSEDEFGRAKLLLATFLGNPADPAYRKQAAQGRELKARAAEQEMEQDARVSERSKVFRTTMPYGVGPLTAVLIGLCLAVQILQVGGYEDRVLRELYMTAIEKVGNGYQIGRAHV